MPTKAAAPTKADYAKLKHEVAGLKGQVTKLKRELATATARNERLATQARTAASLAESLQSKLDDALTRQPAQVAEILARETARETAGGTTDADPRYMYETAETPRGRLFANAAEVSQAEKAEPGYWHRFPQDAKDAWAKDQLTELEDSLDGQTESEATT